jgi:iron complex transport system substrate-binding protein
MTSWLVLWAWVLSAAPSGPQRLGPVKQKAASRVVTLAPSLTDIVLSLGAREVLVGVSRFDEAAEVIRLPRVGGFTDPSVEAVLALNPDLVLVQPGPGNQAPVERMAALGIPILATPLHTVADVFAAYRAIGDALGRQKEAAARIASFEAARARIRRRAAGKPVRRVLIVYGYRPLIVAGKGAFAHELLADVGAQNAASDATSPYASYSVEAVIRARPNVILDCSADAKGAAELRALPPLAHTAFRKASKALMHPGPALEQGLEELFARVHSWD